MAEFTQRKLAFYRDVVRHGVTDLRMLTRIYPLGWDIADEKLQSWLKRFESIPNLGSTPNNPPRLLNHFMTGADPEFIFYEGGRVNAEALGMIAGRAYGADNNGRLAEIRPHPDKSQLRVLASTHATLRWMLATVKEIHNYQMLCGAYLESDGLGGHVHVGRKRKALRDSEVKGLDALSASMEKLKMFPVEECQLRRNGDQFRQRYGLPGDVRPQSHGYEYRTFPSWLDSPWLAYFTLTLSKLAVYDPELFEARTQDQKKHLEFILRYYRGLDDDALLALYALQRYGLPKHIGGDFRARWGLTGYSKETFRKDVEYIPQSIVPHESDVQDLWSYFVEGKPLPTGKIPEPTWSPIAPPRGFQCLGPNTHGAKGLGELIADLVVRTQDAKWFAIGYTREGYNTKGEACPIVVSNRAASKLPRNWKELLPAGTWGYGDVGSIALHRTFLESSKLSKGVRNLLLTSGAFPVWKIQDASEEASKAWDKRLQEAPPERKLIGRTELEAA